MTLPRHPVEAELAPPATVADKRTRCPLCGYRFAVGVTICRTCGVTGNCETVGCPHCGYAFPPESSAIRFFKRLFGRLFGHGAVHRNEEEIRK